MSEGWSADSLVRERWKTLIAGLAAAGFGLSFLRNFVLGGPSLEIDTAFYEHAAWYMTQGGTPYLDIWDVKPPLTFETVAIFGFLSGGNISVLHALAVAATVLAGIGIVILVGILTHRITENEWAALSSSLALMTLGGFHYLASFGYRPKYFAVFFGLLAFYLYYGERPFLSGASAAAAAGYWQIAVVFPVSILGLYAGRSRDVLYRVLGGMAAVAVLVVAPMIALGVAEPMFLQTVVAPLMVPEKSSALLALGRLPLIIKFAGVPAALGLYALLRYGRDYWRTAWWVAVGAGWSIIQILFLDFNGYPDLFMGLSFFAIGVGILVDSVSDVYRKGIVALLVVLVAISIFWTGGTGVVFDPYGTAYKETKESPPLAASVVFAVGKQLGMADDDVDKKYESDVVEVNPSRGVIEMYRNKEFPETCRYRMSGDQVGWVRTINGSLTPKQCNVSISFVLG